jgi:hypothetical protein
MTFPAKTPDEIKMVTFDFSTEAASTSTLSNPTVTATLKSGTGTAADITIAAPQVVSKTVLVLISDGLDGAKYRLSCECDASNGEHHRIDKDLPVKETAAVVS